MVSEAKERQVVRKLAEEAGKACVLPLAEPSIVRNGVGWM